MSTHLVPPLLAAVPLPVLIAGGAVVIVALAALLVWWRYHATRRRVTKRFEEFKDRVMEMRQRVEATRERHRLLTVRDADYTQPMQGTTLAVYNQVEDETKRLWDGWLQRMDAWEKAQALIAAQGFLRIGRLREAERLLDQLGRFEEVEREVRGCVEHLDRLETGHEKARALHTQLQPRPETLRQRIVAVGSLGLAAVPYDAELAKCVALAAEGGTLLTADPLGGLATLEDTRDKMSALEKWIEDVVGLFHRSGEAREQLDEAAQRVAACRARGLRLVEPESNPDPLLEQGREDHTQILPCLQRADAKAARRHLDAALDRVKQADAAIERQEKAKAECTRELPARRAAAERLQRAGAQAQAHRAELERGFAAESWHAVRDNVERSHRLQTDADAAVTEAAAAAGDAVQHYVRATNLLERVGALQKEAGELLPPVERCLRDLTALRQECVQQRQELNNLDRQTQEYLAAHAGIVGHNARSRCDAAAERLRQARAQAEAGRPNWSAVKQQLDEARKGYAAARAAAEEDVAANRKLLARIDDVTREAERVGRLLESHHEDRPRANSCYRAAREDLERVQSESGRGRVGAAPDWTRLLKQLEAAAEELRKAEALAREDLRLADQAQTEMGVASQAVGRAAEHFTSAPSAEVSRAEALFAQAAQHLAAQEYEQAIEKATAARRTASRAVEEAVRLAEEERQRLAATAAPDAPTPLWSESSLVGNAENPASEPSSPGPG